MSSSPKAKKRTLTVRISEALGNTLDLISVGESKPVSEIVRERIEDSVKTDSVDQLLKLQKDERGTLSFLRKRFLNRRPIEPIYWLFLSILVHDAYRLSNRESYESKLLVSVMRAFLNLVTVLSETRHDGLDERYFSSNLSGFCGETLIDRTNDAIKEIESDSSTKVGAQFLVRNLEAILRDECADLDDKVIHAQLAPFGLDLLTLAAKGYSLKNNRFGYTNLPEFIEDMWSDVFESKFFRLQVMAARGEFSAMLEIRDGWVDVDYGFTFSQFEEFIFAVMNDCSADGYQFYNNSKLSLDIKISPIIFGSVSRLSLRDPQVDDLQELLRKCLANERLSNVREKARLVHGAI